MRWKRVDCLGKNFCGGDSGLGRRRRRRRDGGGKKKKTKKKKSSKNNKTVIKQEPVEVFNIHFSS